MGGRLAGSGMGAAGLVTPFTLGGGAGQGGGEMSHIGGPVLAGAAAGAGGAYAYNHHNNNNNENGSPTHTNASSHYPPTTPGTQSIYSSDGYQPTMSSGQYPPNPYAPPLPLGRGPSPGQSMLAGTNSSSGHSHGGGSVVGGMGAAGAGYATSNSTSNPRSAKELEAFGGRRVANPDEGAGPSAGQGEEHLPNPYASVDPQAHAAYLQSGPGRRESVGGEFGGGGAGPAFPHPQHHQASFAPAQPYAQPAAQGSGVIVHRDGGRIPDRGGEEQAEIPPTYDSIPKEER
ncbi:hypothetical protein BDQ12DRAFT_215291 [Crucibulum laeve]|uniref:Uncharacterized protein n=1 Tax=Crucibulum laeve TaxID=68775 RepID=A0A5C3LWT0_9AGAR|nr:hypothetical protein BDQ12DRAFT_215291 [Crucibulum laeve]